MEVRKGIVIVIPRIHSGQHMEVAIGCRRVVHRRRWACERILGRRPTGREVRAEPIGREGVESLYRTEIIRWNMTEA